MSAEQAAEIDASRPMGTFTDRQVWQTISRHAFIVSVGAYGRESCACGWYRDGWDSPGFEAHFAAHITPLVMAAEQRAKEAEQRARHHYAAFCGAAAELARLKTAADKVGHQAACLVEPCDCWMLDLLPLLDGGTCDWCGLVGDHAEGCRQFAAWLVVGLAVWAALIVLVAVPLGRAARTDQWDLYWAGGEFPVTRPDLDGEAQVVAEAEAIVKAAAS